MAEVPKKRRLPPKILKMKERKLRKLNNNVDDSENKVVAPEGPKIGDIVKADELRWQEVTPPDKLDDYGGFYGLEEIEGIDVVKNSANGQVSFKHVGVKKLPEKYKAKNTGQHDGKKSNDKKNAVHSNRENSWQGFEEEEEDTAGVIVQTQNSPKDKSSGVSSKKNKEQPTKGTKFKSKKKGANVDNGASFDILAETAENDGVDVSAWRSLQLSADILASLSALKFNSPTPIQSQAIPEIISGHDLIGKAPTGSGKTLAFGIPIVEHWLSQKHSRNTTVDKPPHTPLALITLPTRELAHQITKHLQALCSQPGLEEISIVSLTGGLAIQKQKRLLGAADIVVATPGRLWEVVSEVSGALYSLRGIKYLVVDEADRLLSEGHFKELEQVLTALDRKVYDENSDKPDESNSPTHSPSQRQTLVFSATFSKSLQQNLSKYSPRDFDLASNQASMEYLLRRLNFAERKPRFLDVNPVSQMAANLTEGLVECPAALQKDLYLYAILLLHNPATTRALVFVNSISAVRRLVPLLRNLDLPTYPLHSSMPQKARLTSIEKFTNTTSSTSSSTSGGAILIATDVAARGLDLPAIHLVLHYHLPRTADAYVHRSGRTARAAAPGASVLLCAPGEAAGVRRLVARVHRRGAHLRTVDVDARVVAQVRRRVALAKRLADGALAGERARAEDGWVREAAAELGVDVDAPEFEAGGGGRKRRKRGEEVGKAEREACRAELKGLLAQRVNTGASARYLVGVDVGELLRGEARREFLGAVPELGLQE